MGDQETAHAAIFSVSRSSDIIRFRARDTARIPPEPGHGRGHGRGLTTLTIALIAPFAFADAAPAQAPGLQPDVVFTDYSPLSGNAEIVRRLLSPLAAAQIQLALAGSGKAMSAQSVDLAKETFTLYVPPQPPPHGYGLLVFVPPSQDAGLPEGWASVLDRHGVIFVAAARSGNDQNPLARRAPLALLAAANVMRRYPVDPDRVYVGGFSGGARIAMRLALGYPDLFRGALLNAGSDPIGDGPPAPPPRELFLRFQSSTHVVYVTGEQDAERRQMDIRSIQSLHNWCVFALDAHIVPWAGHQVASPGALSWALNALQRPARSDPNALAACRSDVERDLAGKLQQVQTLIAAGKHDDAQKALISLDARFGGLAAPLSVDLAQK